MVSCVHPFQAWLSQRECVGESVARAVEVLRQDITEDCLEKILHMTSEVRKGVWQTFGVVSSSLS